MAIQGGTPVGWYAEEVNGQIVIKNENNQAVMTFPDMGVAAEFIAKLVTALKSLKTKGG